MAKTTKKTMVEFDTSEYRFSHGKAPRGKGCWWFFIWVYSPVAVSIDVQARGSYIEAKKEAKKKARAFAASYGSPFVRIVVGS